MNTPTSSSLTSSSVTPIRFIIGTEHFGYQFMNDVVRYCQDTGQPQRPELYKAIYHESISQIFSRIDVSFEAFMLNLMELPQWETIYYGEQDLDMQLTKPFAAQFRAFAITLWGRMKTRQTLLPNRYYLLESEDEQLLVVASYPAMTRPQP